MAKTSLLLVGYEKNMRVWNMSCGCMRASTVRCRVLDRCAYNMHMSQCGSYKFGRMCGKKAENS